MVWGLLLSAFILYAANFYLFFFYFKEKKIKDSLERLAIMFGTNMSVLLVDALILFFGAVIDESAILFLIF